MTLEEQIEAIAERKANEIAEPLRREIANIRRLVVELDERISTPEIQKLTGINDVRTLKKRFKWLQKGTGPITWSKAEVLEWISQNEIAA